MSSADDPAWVTSSGVSASRLDTGKKVRNHIRQLEALGYTVTLTETA